MQKSHVLPRLTQWLILTVALTVVFDSLGVFLVGVWRYPMNLHSHKGVQAFIAPTDRKVGSTDNLMAHKCKIERSGNV